MHKGYDAECFFMSSFNIIPILPFWILGVPLAVAIISLIRLPKQSELARSDGDRNNPR